MMKILVVGEAFIGTGFARVTEGILRVLENKPNVELFWYGVNLRETPPEARTLNAQTFNRCKLRSDPLGYAGLQEVAEMVDPDLTILLNDAGPCAIWGNRMRGQAPREEWAPIVGYVPVDGEIVDWRPYENCERYGVRLVSYTKYGADELEKGQADKNRTIQPGPVGWCYPGLDLGVFNTAGRSTAREYWNEQAGKMMLAPDDFVVCMTSRNAPRKLLHEMIFALGEFARDKADVKVIIRAARMDWGGDYFQTLDAAGLRNVLTVGADNGPSDYIEDAELARIYQASDVFLSASLTEGFGYCEYEAAACGCNLILPENTVRPELWREALLLRCERKIYAPHMANTVGGLVSRASMVDALEGTYWADTASWIRAGHLTKIARRRGEEWTWERLVGVLVGEAGRGKSEVSIQKSEVSGQESEVSGQESVG